MAATKLLLTKKEAAEALSISVPTLDRMVRKKRIRTVPVGQGKERKQVRFAIADLQAFIGSPATT